MPHCLCGKLKITDAQEIDSDETDNAQTDGGSTGGQLMDIDSDDMEDMWEEAASHNFSITTSHNFSQPLMTFHNFSQPLMPSHDLSQPLMTSPDLSQPLLTKTKPIKWTDMTPNKMLQQQVKIVPTQTIWVDETEIETLNPKERGRPRKVTEDTVIQLCNLMHHNVSSTSAGPILASVLGSPEYDVHRSTVDRASVTGLLSLKYALAFRVGVSRDLFFTSDGAGAKRGQDFIAMKIGGLLEETEEVWIETAIWEERAGTLGAKEEVELLEKLWSELNDIQREQGWPVILLYHLESCVYDNATVNTGAINGVGARVQKARQKAWIAASKDAKIYHCW